MTDLLGGTSTLTWATSGQTTVIDTTTSDFTDTRGSCKRGEVEYTLDGVVTGGSSTYTTVDDYVAADLCLNVKSNKITLPPGEKASL